MTAHGAPIRDFFSETESSQ